MVPPPRSARECFRLYSSVPCGYKSAAPRPELSSKPEQFAMTRYQVLLLPAVAAAILILGGALNPKAPLAQPAIAAATAGPNDPQALEILDQAIAALAPERLPWTEANVWQQIRYEGISFQACGRMFTAPGDRTRFDLNVKVGKSLGELRVVSDGKTLCQWLRIGGDKPVVRCWEL